CTDIKEHAKVLTTGDGPFMPSVLYFRSPEDYVFGAQAKAESGADFAAKVSNIKRALTADGRTIHNVHFAPERIVHVMMREFISVAARTLQEIPTHLVVTVPVGFSERQRRIVSDATLEAGKGFVRRVDVVDEPTAAAMHYVWSHEAEFAKASADHPVRILVFDFGGGTLDIAILSVTNEGFQIRARRGDPRLGGLDMDRLVADHLAMEAKREYPAFEARAVTLPRKRYQAAFGDKPAFYNLRMAFAETAERIKIALSEASEEAFVLSYTAANRQFDQDLLDEAGKTIPLHDDADVFSGAMREPQLAELIDERRERCIRVLENSLIAAALDKNDIDIVLMTGQVCYMPSVRKAVKDFFEGVDAAIPEADEFEMKQCVALGAAKLALMMEGMPLPRTGLHSNVGTIGYFSSGLARRFVEILPDRHPYGEEGEKPAQVQLDHHGEGFLTVYQNLGRSETLSKDTADDFIQLARIHVQIEDKPGAMVDVYLGLDGNGNLTARTGDRRWKPQLLSTEADEVF
ncbi:MAG TPA: Hsp70 family protein, partial [Candidatus Hydrogenedentes bacterium]|nr:Hsp70 family protein [Candidatus Hydrogenedentota bacterium]